MLLFKAIKLIGLQTYEKYGKNQKENNTKGATERDAHRRFSRDNTP